MIGPSNMLLDRRRLTGLQDIYVDRDKESFGYAQGIDKAYGTLGDVLDWCKSELTADWRWQMIEMSATDRPGRYIFYFDSERDCLAFTLKWC